MTVRTANSFKSKLHSCAGVVALVAAGLAAPAQNADAQVLEFNMPAQDLGAALKSYGVAADGQVMVDTSLVEGKRAPAIVGEMSADEALEKILSDSGLSYRVTASNVVLIGHPVAMQFAETEGRRGSFRAAQTDQREAGAVETVTDVRDEEDDEPRPSDEIVVTGTNIRGVSPDSSPSFVYDKEDIAKTGVSTVSEFVQTLPQNFGGGANADTAGGLTNDRTALQNTASGSSVNLRGLGSGSTLVLLNGRRLAPSGALGDFVDISMIPLSAVDRVELLTDGASAIYGADAIAGVVNFVLRDDYDGAETFVRFGSVTEGDLQEYRAGQTIGKSWDTGNALISYEYFDRDNLGAEEKGFSSAATLPLDLLPGQESHNVLLHATQQLSDGVTLHGHGTFSKRDTSTVATNCCGFQTTFRDSGIEQYGGSAGADIELAGDWLLEVSGAYSKVTSVTHIDIPVTSTAQDTRIESDLWSVDAKVDGTVFQFPGGAVKVAAGLGYREEAFLVELDGGALSGIFSQDGRDAFSIFGETFIPIIGAGNRVPGVERLKLTLAARYDDYNDFGDTFNPKVGLLWSPVGELDVRATYSTSFNPPNLGDTGGTLKQVFVFNVSNPASMTGTSLAILDFSANPDLGPEESTTWTAGFDSELDIGPGNLDISMTWFDISFTDRIGLAGSPFSFFNDPVAFADVIIADPDPAETAAIIAEATVFRNIAGSAWMMPGDEEFLLDARLRNLASVDTTGLDVSLAYSVDTSIGQMSFGLNGNRLFQQEKKITANAPVFDVVGLVFNPVDLRLRGSATWTLGGWGASTFVNYVDGYVDDRNLLGTGDVPVDSWTTVDLSLGFDTGDRPGQHLMGNARFSVIVQNLLDRDPPAIEMAAGSDGRFDPTNANALGRFISFQITKEW